VVEWVEVRGKTVDVAVAAAMQELSIADRESVDVEVIQEPEKGFLGLGGRDAIVRVKPRTQARNRKRRRGRGDDEGERRPPSSQGSRAPSVRGDRPRTGPRPGGNGQGGGGQPQSRRPQGQDRRSNRLLEIRADLARRPAPQATDTAIETPAIIRVVLVAHHERERQG